MNLLHIHVVSMIVMPMMNLKGQQILENEHQTKTLFLIFDSECFSLSNLEVKHR